jgi:hypothetical protein
MNYIHEIVLRQLRNAEYIELEHGILDIINGVPPVKADLLTQYTIASDTLTLLNNAFLNDPASPLTTEINNLDDQRDQIITGLVAVTDGYCYSPIAAQAAAAAVLSHNLKVYGKSIAKQAFNAESTIIDNIVNDWTTQTALSNAVTTLGLGGWVTALSTANTQFRTKYAARTAALATESLVTPKSVSELRPEADLALTNLLKKLDGYYGVNDGTAPWNIVVAEVNVLIDKYNALLAGRKTRAKKDEPAPVAA